MPDFSRPIVVVSKCLGFANCRYNGGIIYSPLIKTMKPFVEFIDVCPECEIGLRVPREPIMIVGEKERKLIQPATGLDLTGKMKTFSHSYLEKLDDFDGFVLKSKSPSCGVKTTKVFQDLDSGRCVHHEGNGFFAEEILNSYPELPVIDQEQLKDPVLRDCFLTHVFALASFRKALATGEIGALVEYQTRNKLLFMAYNKELLLSMGKLAGNSNNLPAEEIYEKYLLLLIQILSGPVKSGYAVDAFMHAFGYFSRYLNAGDKFGFMQKLQQYREDSLEIFELRKWFLAKAEEYNIEYLLKQTLFCPYPAEISDNLEIG